MDNSGLIVISICFTLMSWAIVEQIAKDMGRELSSISSWLFLIANLISWYHIAKYLLGVK